MENEVKWNKSRGWRWNSRWRLGTRDMVPDSKYWEDDTIGTGGSDKGEKGNYMGTLEVVNNSLIYSYGCWYLKTSPYIENKRILFI